MSSVFRVYRVLAFVVGVLLSVMAFVGMPLKYLLTEGTSAQRFGEDVVSVVGVTHGMLYMVYVVVAFVLAVNMRWDAPFMLLVLAAGVVPLLIFWVERKVEARYAASTRAAAPAPPG